MIADNDAQESAPSQPPELRAHHLLCALTFRSRGYGPDFVQQFDAIIKRLIAGEAVTLTRTADKLCQSTQNCGQCQSEQSVHRDEQALRDIQALLGPDSHDAPVQLTPSNLTILRQAFADGRLRQACTDCAWFSFCSKIAANDFRRAQLQLSTR